MDTAERYGDERTTGLGALLTVAEVAAALTTSRATVYRLINDGLLPPIRIREGGHTRIARADVDALIVRRRAEGTQRP
jgi:excisionase family DNA binding protein